MINHCPGSGRQSSHSRARNRTLLSRLEGGGLPVEEPAAGAFDSGSPASDPESLGSEPMEKGSSSESDPIEKASPGSPTATPPAPGGTPGGPPSPPAPSMSEGLVGLVEPLLEEPLKTDDPSPGGLELSFPSSEELELSLPSLPD